MPAKGSKQAIEKRNRPKIDKSFDVNSVPDIYKCTKCGKRVVDPEGKFYKNISNPLYKNNDGYTTLCTYCIDELFDDLRVKYSDEKLALLLCCAEVGWFFSEATYLKMKEKDSADIRIGDYVKRLNLSQNKNLTFQDYLIGSLNNQKVLATKVEENELLEEKWSKEDKQNKQSVIDVVGYDPFEDYPLSDRRYLFNELIKYFDDDIAEDTYKLSQIIQIVNNNNQIRHYDMLIATLKPLTDSKDIGTLNNLKSTLVQANDKIAKENEISVKNRSNKEAGKSTLTYLQKYLRELDFERAEADYYDQLRSEGTLWGIEMSIKAIQKNAYFDDDDLNEIQTIRRQLVIDLQKQVDDLMEEKRQLTSKIQKLERGDGNEEEVED